MLSHGWLFTWLMGTPTHVLMLSEQVHLPTDASPWLQTIIVRGRAQPYFQPTFLDSQEMSLPWSTSFFLCRAGSSCWGPSL